MNTQQIERQDFVDSSIYELLQKLNTTEENLNWDIEMIGQVRDVVSSCLANRNKDFDSDVFYP